jgi:hypothetical protein
VVKIFHRPHLLRRLNERKIPKDYPKIIYQKSKQHYFDNETKHYVAVSKLRYAQKVRSMAAAYDIIGPDIEIITIFPISETELTNKINSERWIKK